MFQNVAVQWLIRRIPEWGGIIASLVAFITLAPPDVQATLWAVLSGQGGAQTATAYIGVISWVYAQVISYRSTVKAQAVVLEDGKLVTNTLTPTKGKEVAKTVENVSSKKSLIEILLGK